MKGGCEAIVHSISHIIDDTDLPLNSRWILQLDFSNTFNSISRRLMFEEFRARIPSLSTWMECCYNSQPALRFGEHIIFSCCGVQQGDPLGPLGFALTLQSIVERIKREVPSLHINVWYLDDGTLCSSPDDLQRVLEIVEEDGPSRGLILNRSKSLLFIPQGADASSNPLPPKSPSQDLVSVSLAHLLAQLPSVSLLSCQEWRRLRQLCLSYTILRTPRWRQPCFGSISLCLSLISF